MKRLKFFLFVAIAALLFSCKSNTNDTTNVNATKVDLAPSGSIVYVQLDSLVNQYDMFNDLKSELEAKIATIQNDLAKQGRDLENSAKDFENKVKKGLLTQSQAELQNRQLVERDQTLQNLSRQKQIEIQEEQDVLYRKVMDAIQTYLQSYNETHNYALILSTSAASNTVMIGNPSLDITSDVLNGLNEEYIKTKNNNAK